MERLTKSVWFAVLVYALLALGVLFLLLQIKPLIIALFRFLKAVLVPFIIALIISYLLNPIVNLLNQRKVPRTAAVLIIYAVFIVSVTVIFMNLTPVFIKQLNELNEHLPELARNAERLLTMLNENDLLPESVRMGINSAIFEAELGLAETIAAFVRRIGTTMNVLFTAMVIPFLAFYMMKDFQLIEKTVLTFMPSKHKRRIIRLVTDIDKALGNYIRGQLLVCLIIGICAYIGYWLIGLPYPLLLASLVAVFNVIPYIGPFFGAAPALLVAATVSVKMMVLVAVVNTACQVLEGNVISPQVVGKTLHMHPLMIIFALLAGGQIGGVIGLILAVPMFAVGKVIIHHLRLHLKNRKPVT